MQMTITQMWNLLLGIIRDVNLYQVRTLVQNSNIIARGSTKSHIVSASINLALSTRSGFLTTGNDSSFSSSLSSIIALTLLRLFFSGSSNYVASASSVAFTAISSSSSTWLCSSWLGVKEDNLSCEGVLGVIVAAVPLLFFKSQKNFLQPCISM